MIKINVIFPLLGVGVFSVLVGQVFQSSKFTIKPKEKDLADVCVSKKVISTNLNIDEDLEKAKVVSFKSLLPMRGPASVAGLDVTIDVGQVAYLDESTNIDTLTINGSLFCNESQADDVVELRVKTIYINGTFQCGTNNNPYSKKLIISLKPSGVDPKQNPAYRGIIVNTGGKLNLNGDRTKAGWYRLDQTAMPGDDFIIVKPSSTTTNDPPPPPPANRGEYLSNRALQGQSVQGVQWDVGDEIVVAPTGFNYLEAEKFTITQVDFNNPNKFYLDRPISYMHWGETKTYHTVKFGEVELDESAEVANLTRSILIRADELDGTIDEGNGATAQLGGHIMAHHGSKSYINGIELYKMGQAGVMARYPFHWHFVGNAPGQYIKNSSIHHSYQRCVTVHQTSKTRVENNVCFDFKGHGYFLEDGNEVDNKLIHNLAIMAKGPHSSKRLLASDHIETSEGQGRFPSVSGIWISNPNNYVVDNVVAGSVGSGIWMSFEAEVKNGSGQVIARPLTTATDTFRDNTAHSCKTGITWDGAPGWENANNPNNPKDKKLVGAHYNPPVIPTFKGLKAYKNYLSGIYFRGQTAIFDNTITADNGWSFWVAYNQIVKDSVFIGKTENQSSAIDSYYYSKTRSDRYMKTGIVIYDGPFEIHHSDFIDFSTSPETFTLQNNQTINSTTVPFTVTGGTNKFTNFVSGVHFSPEPLHRMFIEDADVNINYRQMLVTSVIRDDDGSLSNTGTPSVIIGTRSLGVLPNSQCVNGGISHYNYKICPENYFEGTLTFMRWNSPSPWGTPFVVVRSDGLSNYPINEWAQVVIGKPNNLFSTANSLFYTYDLLPKYQYEYDRTTGAKAAVDATAELAENVTPVVRVAAYGYNCHLDGGAVQVNSLQALYSQTQTAYFSNGENLYMRVIPKQHWYPITIDPRVRATAVANASVLRYFITCDPGYINKEVRGRIETVTRGNTTIVSGWACNYTHSNSIQVKLYAGSNMTIQGDSQRKGMMPANTLTLIAQQTSNLTPDTRVGVKCGNISSLGRKFSFSIPTSQLSGYRNHKFYVEGISNSGGANVFIDGSGNFNVLPPPPNQKTRKSSL